MNNSTFLIDNKSTLVRNARIPFFCTEILFLVHVLVILNTSNISVLSTVSFFCVSTGLLALIGSVMQTYSLIKTKLLNPLYENFTLILFFASFLIYADIICLMVDGAEDYIALNLIMQTISYLLITLLLNLYFGFVYAWEGKNSSSHKSLKNLINTFTFVTILFILGNIPFKYFFIISDTGSCVSTEYVFIFVILIFLIISCTAVYTLISGISASDKITLILVPIIPFMVAIVSSYYNGPKYHLMTLISVEFLYTTFIVKKEHELQEKELLISQRDKQLTNSEINALRSKMNPHFIYNTLSSIYGLCKTNPEGAADMTLKLENYLRDNFGKISIEPMIPLFEELEHLMFYIEIEKIRFPNLNVEFDADIDYFMVPSLSIQPMVENAIRHGIQKNMDASGTIKISTTESDEGYFILIEDDGVGINEDFNNDGKVHLGINNTRKRIKLLCGGTLNVRPRSPRGTSCEIFIPK